MGGVLFANQGSSWLAQQGALALHEAGLLEAYLTTFVHRPEGWPARLLRALPGPGPRRAERLLERRRIDGVPARYLRTYPAWELARLIAPRLGLGPVVEDLIWERGTRSFSRRVAHAARGGAAAVYAGEHAALEAFQAARRAGLRTIYYQASPHHRTMSAVLEREFAAFPELRGPYDEHIRALAARRAARRDAELDLADLVIAASRFSRRSLTEAGIPAGRIAVVPLGAPPPQPREPAPGGPAIFLSAGNQAVHKGTHYLLQAWRALRPGPGAELWLVGRMHLPERLLRDLPGRVVVRPSVSYAELSAIYRRAAALAFPSLCDGFGSVITEAMAHGLPVITTPHTAGPDIITPGHDGLLVPAGDAAALAGAMEWCLSRPDELAELGRRAAARAARMQWEQYRRSFAAAVGAALGAGWADEGGDRCGASAW